MALSSRLLSGISRSSRLFSPATGQWYSGGDAGSIRDAGGSFAKKEKAVEDQYFKRLEKEQLEKMHKMKQEHHEEEIEHHQESIRDLEEQIKRHKEKINRHKEKMDEN